MSTTETHSPGNLIPERKGFTERALNFIERNGNRLPTPAMLFLYGLALTLVLSCLFSFISFEMIDPRSGQAIEVKNLLRGDYLAGFFASMVTTFTSFPPLGVVLVAIMGVGVAEDSGFINTTLKKLLVMTPTRFITPMVVFIGAVSSIASDAGYVLVIPMGGIFFTPLAVIHWPVWLQLLPACPAASPPVCCPGRPTHWCRASPRLPHRLWIQPTW